MPFDPPPDPAPLAEIARKPDLFLIIIKTTTREKVVQYQAVARALKIPVQFRSLNELVESFHAAEEDTGDREKNAEQKFYEGDKVARILYNPTSPYYKLLQEKCLEWGVVFNPDHIYLAADDSTFETHNKVWGNLRKKLNRLVPPNLLKSADRNGKAVGPGAETGPISAAVGVRLFFDLFYDAADEVGVLHSKKESQNHPEQPNVPVNVTKTLVVRSLSEAAVGAKPHSLNASTTLYPHIPGKKEKLFFQGPNVPIIQTEHFLKAHPDMKTPIANNLFDFLVALSPARQIVQLFYTLARERPSLFPVDDEAVFEAAKQKITTPTDFNVIQPRRTLRETNEDATFYDVLSLAAEFKDGDALEFLPFDSSNEKVRRYNFYKLFSAIVAKQLDARFMNIPIIVHDDGCWAPAIKLLIEQANHGMSKDYDYSLYENGPLVRIDGGKHFATAYLDVIRGRDAGARDQAAERVKAIRRTNYSRFRQPEPDTIDAWKNAATALSDETDNERKEKPAGLFSVAVFTSAVSDNRKLIITLEKFGRFLANLRSGLIWGAGDRHAMGAIFEGYWQIAKKTAKRWLAGFTTRIIAESETKLGRRPDVCDFPAEYSENIYRRMADMIHYADAIVVAPGGPGTTQELLAALVLRDQLPEKMRNKPIIIYSPDIHADNKKSKNFFWESAVRLFLGNAFWNQLRQNPTKGLNGIYLATNLTDLRHITEKLKLDFDNVHSDLGNGRPTIPAWQISQFRNNQKHRGFVRT